MRFWGLAAVLLLFFGTAAAAASWDTNSDGVLSEQEIASWLMKRIVLFDRVDKNHDGFVDLEELYARFPGRRGDAVIQKKFARDDNSDGRLNQEEWTVAEQLHISMAVKQCDADADGVLKGGEIKCAEKLPW